jgi:uncharacterized protein YecE (DUF72 family)
MNIRRTDLKIRIKSRGVKGGATSVAPSISCALVSTTMSKRAGVIRVGTSAFTAAGWEGSFYPSGMKPTEFLNFYATRFITVEVDATYYRTPSASTVAGWAAKTPDDFIFSLKVPQQVTHEKVLVDCEKDFESFVEVVSGLGRKLGPMLLQFPYFNRAKFKAGSEFLARL